MDDTLDRPPDIAAEQEKGSQPSASALERWESEGGALRRMLDASGDSSRSRLFPIAIG